jgi:iron uptake system component EfeO
MMRANLLAMALACAMPASATRADGLAITVNDKGCDPTSLQTPSGATTFDITNGSSRVLEFEILSGVKIVAERENILPGFKQSFTATLDPGTYAIACGLLSNPKGVLTVTGDSGTGQTGSAAPVDLAVPVAAYTAFVQSEAAGFLAATTQFVAAVKAGDVAGAKAKYAAARAGFERIEPVTELFSDLDTAIDSRADDWEKREADPGFGGFHRLEYALFVKGDVADMGPVADKLLADATELNARVAALEIPPSVMVGGAAALIEEVAGSKISGEEDRYSGTDLSDFAANVEGAAKIVTLISPMVQQRNAELLTRTNTNLADVMAVLDTYRTPEGFKPYSDLTEADRNLLKGKIAALAEDLSQFPGLLGLQAN